MRAVEEGDDDMPDEVDFSSGTRGHFAGRLSRAMQVVVIEPDVAEVFVTSEDVNQALRKVMRDRLPATDERSKAS